MSEAAALEEPSVKFGLLMEAAQTHQELADASLQKLQIHTEGLDGIVRETIRQTLVEELSQVQQEAGSAAQTLRELQRAVRVRAIGGSGLVIMAIGGLVGLLLRWWLPNPQQLAQLRAQRDELQQVVTQLQQSGARAQLRRCGQAARLCVRVDRRAPAFGEQSDFLILKGY